MESSNRDFFLLLKDFQPFFYFELSNTPIKTSIDHSLFLLYFNHIPGAYNNCRKMNGLMKGFNCVKSIIKVKECVTCVCSVIPKVCQRLKFAIG